MRTVSIVAALAVVLATSTGADARYANIFAHHAVAAGNSTNVTSSVPTTQAATTVPVTVAPTTAPTTGQEIIVGLPALNTAATDAATTAPATTAAPTTVAATTVAAATTQAPATVSANTTAPTTSVPVTAAATSASAVPVVISNGVAPTASATQAAAAITGSSNSSGLAVCNVIDPTRKEAPWAGSESAFPQFYTVANYVCVDGNFLCPTTAPLRCAYACYTSAQYYCSNGKLIQNGSPAAGANAVSASPAASTAATTPAVTAAPATSAIAAPVFIPATQGYAIPAKNSTNSTSTGVASALFRQIFPRA